MDYEAIIATNDDAALCKYYAVAKGYYRDTFISKFLPNSLVSSSSGKPPEINLGYYARSTSIAYIVEQFIRTNPSCQIINLGAGYDSLFWRLKSYSSRSDQISMSGVKYIEIDLVEVTSKKMMNIMKHSDLKSHLKSPKRGGQDLYDESYDLVSFDLRKKEKETLEQKLIVECQIDYAKPTLCITECVLVYMPVADSASLIRWLSERFSNLTMLNYEQCNMRDKFGDVMLSNMNARHCDLMGVDACKSLDSQTSRFEISGLKHTKAWNLNQIFDECLLPNEVERIDKIESLDEKELLRQLLEHYCIVLGSNQPIDWLDDQKYWLSESCRHLQDLNSPSPLP